MDDDWHSLYPVLCRIGRVHDWVEWQAELALAMGAMQAWHCGRVNELMDACEAALFDATSTTAWPALVPRGVIAVAEALPVPRRAQVAVLQCALSSAARFYAPPIVPAPRWSLPRAVGPRHMFSASLRQAMARSLGGELSAALLSKLASLLRSPVHASATFQLYTTFSVDEEALHKAIVVCSHDLVKASSIVIVPDFARHENGKVVSVTMHTAQHN